MRYLDRGCESRQRATHLRRKTEAAIEQGRPEAGGFSDRHRLDPPAVRMRAVADFSGLTDEELKARLAEAVEEIAEAARSAAAAGDVPATESARFQGATEMLNAVGAEYQRRRNGA
jgi:hypothetical protein